MRELVEGNVAAILKIARIPAHFVPGKDDRSAQPRFAEPAFVALMNNAHFVDELRRREVGARINQDRMQSRIIVMLAIKQENAGLRRDRDPDLVGNSLTAASFKLLFRQENANEFLQLYLFVR